MIPAWSGDQVTGLFLSPFGRLAWIDVVAGFGFGLFTFQSLSMKDTMGGSYRAAVRRSLLAEWLSMNFMMAGMLPSR